MLLFGVNFTYSPSADEKEFRPALAEFRAAPLHLGFASFGTFTIALRHHGQLHGGFWHALRYSYFQVSSIMTTTGFATADFKPLTGLFQSHAHPARCSLTPRCGSTGGGLKVSEIAFHSRQSGRGGSRQKCSTPGFSSPFVYERHSVDSAIYPLYAGVLRRLHRHPFISTHPSYLFSWTASS